MNAIAAGPGFPRAPPSEYISNCFGIFCLSSNLASIHSRFSVLIVPQFFQLKYKTIFVFPQTFLDFFPCSRATFVFHPNHAMNYPVDLCFILLRYSDTGFRKDALQMSEVTSHNNTLHSHSQKSHVNHSVSLRSFSV